MKGDPQVMAGLQEAINLEASLTLQYFLDQRNAKRYGLDIADGLKELSEQSQDHTKHLTSRLLFLDGAPEIAAQPAKSHATVTEILTNALASETAIVARYSSLCKAAYEAGDMEIFHFYQHLAKWHRLGDDKFKGHIAWLQKQLWQLGEFGEKDYEATKV